MSKSNNSSRFTNFTIIAIITFSIGYAIHHKYQISDSKSKAISIKTVESSVQSNISLKDSIVRYGMEFLGTPYEVAGCSKDGFDCSGFVYFVFQHFKIEVPRSSAEFENFGKEIPIETVQNGDILLFLSPTRNVIGHIGIVSNSKGDKSQFIHATSGREMKVIISSLTNEGYKHRFVKAIRVI